MTKSIDVVPTWYWPDGVPRYVSPPRSTIYKAALERWARRTPDSLALRGNGIEIDYRSLDERVRLASARIGRALDGQDGPSDERRRLAVAADGVEGVVALFGALHAGTDALLIDPATPPDELATVLEGFGCELLIGAAEQGRRGPWEAVNAHRIAQSAATGDDHADTRPADRSDVGRLGFRWGDAVVLQPNGPLLGWALAFRAFAELDKGDRFTVVRPLASWESLIGLLAPLLVGATSLLPAGSFEEILGAANGGPAGGIWLDWEQADVLIERTGWSGKAAWQWVYVSVHSPVPVRKRRRLGRLLGTPVLTAFGTPATGPVAASPRSWFIEEAVGTPMTGVDLVPVDHPTGHVAEPPWPLLAYASVGVKSTFLAPDMAFEGGAPGRFVEPDVLDTGVAGRIDANGFLYLV